MRSFKDYLSDVLEGEVMATNDVRDDQPSKKQRSRKGLAVSKGTNTGLNTESDAFKKLVHAYNTFDRIDITDMSREERRKLMLGIK